MNNDACQLDLRESYRCAIPDQQRAAELRIDRRQLAVRLCNQSSGGFGTLAVENPQAAPGDIVELTTAMGQFEVRIAYIHPVEVPEEQGGGIVYRIGLERLDDVQPQYRGKSAVSSRSLFTGSVKGVRVLLVALAVAFAIVGLIVRRGVLTTWLRDEGGSLWRPFSQIADFLK